MMGVVGREGVSAKFDEPLPSSKASFTAVKFFLFVEGLHKENYGVLYYHSL